MKILNEKHLTRQYSRVTKHTSKTEQLSDVKIGDMCIACWEDAQKKFKIRPVLVLSRKASSVIVAEVTSHSPRSDYKGEVLLSMQDALDAGLNKQSTIRLTQQATIPIKLLLARIGSLNDEAIDYINDDIKNLGTDEVTHSRYYTDKYSNTLKVKKNESVDTAKKDTGVKSNGIYSVLSNKWIKEPVQSDIPDVDKEAFDKMFTEWEDRYFDLVDDADTEVTSEKVSDFIEDLYDLRKKSISEEGEYGLGNLVFKEMRNMGYLDNLKDYKNELRSKELSLENLSKGEND